MTNKEIKELKSFRNGKKAWNMHYALVCDGEIVAEDNSWDSICSYGDEHADDYPNNKVYAIWDLREGLYTHITHMANAERNIDFDKEEKKFLDKCAKKFDMSKIEKEDFTDCWH